MAAFSGNILYYAQFAGKSINYRVEIRKASYAGAATQIVNLTSDPLILRHVDVETSTIQGTEAVFSFMVAKADFNNFDALVTGDIFDYKFTVYNVQNISNPLWSGFVMPNETTRSYFDKTSVFSLTATDFLSSLKYIKYLDSAGYAIAGRIQPELILAQCLDKIPDFEYFAVNCSLTETNMAALTRSPLYRCYVNAKIFSSIKNGIRVQDNCYDVVNQILQIFSCKICSPFHSLAKYPTNYMKFVITNNFESISTNWYSRYTGGALSYISNTANYDSAVNIDSYQFSLNSEFSREKPLKCIELVQHNFDGGIDASSDNFMTVTNGVIWDWLGLNSLTSPTSTALLLVSNATSIGSITTHNYYTLQSDYGNSYIRLSFDLYNNYGYAACTPSVLITKKVGSTVFSPKVDTLPVIQPNSSYKFVSGATSVYEIEDGAEYKIEIRFTTPTSSVKSIYISNFKFSTYFYENGSVLENVTFDENYTAYTAIGYEPSITLNSKLGDSYKAGNDSAITYSTTESQLTRTWKRHSVTESRSIQDLLFQSYFNRFGGDSRILKISIYDPADAINLANRITLESKTYHILDYEKNLKNGWLNLRLVKVNATDISMSYTYNALPTSSTGSGETVSGGTGGVVGGSTVVNNYYQVTGVANHSQLNALSSDDHQQYAKKVGDTFSGSLVAQAGIVCSITAKNGTATPSEYPNGLSTMAVGSSQTGWVTTYGTVQTLKNSDSSRACQYFYQVGGNYAVYYRHRIDGTDTWQSWKEIITANTVLNTITGTASLTGTDNKKIIEFNSSSNFTYTIDQMTAGFSADLVNINTGDVTLAAGTGVTLRYVNTNRKLTSQYQAVSIYFRSATECVIVGLLDA
jgi:hypothetical protein